MLDKELFKTLVSNGITRHIPYTTLVLVPLAPPLLFVVDVAHLSYLLEMSA